MIQLTVVVLNCPSCNTVFQPLTIEPENGQASGRLNTMLKFECQECHNVSFINVSVVQATFGCECKLNTCKKYNEDFLHEINIIDPDETLGDPE